MTRIFILYNGRAIHDEDRAQVPEACGSDFTRESFDTWRGVDAVLFVYDAQRVDGEWTATNGRRVAHLLDANTYEQVIRDIKREIEKCT